MSCGKEHKGQQEIIICKGDDDFATRAATLFAKLTAEGLSSQKTVHVALSGGSTPKLLYERLLKSDLKSQVRWDAVEVYVSDERCVPSASQESNFGNATRQLLSQVPVVDEHVHPTRDQDRDPEKAALEYDRLIRGLVPMSDHGLPRFDVVFLGMGPDGHTASLFPGTEALLDDARLVVSNPVEKLRAERITFTYPLINSAANVIFMVKGADKADVLADVINHRATQYPASRVDPDHGTLYWVLDESAASKLTPAMC